jgi:hypothetical protein
MNLTSVSHRERLLCAYKVQDQLRWNAHTTTALFLCDRRSHSFSYILFRTDVWDVEHIFIFSRFQ